jgi:NAD(P)-dependent dehydrogenase (short-subunit alcohol dehydrogenase family)/catechol 2,3-dioxygenase-like lactoylglutathione lyase family enzyme
MKIAIIGSGNVGTAIARAVTGVGHDAVVAGVTEDGLNAVAESVPVATTTSNSEAAAGADVVVLAVPFSVVHDVVGELADELADKIIIDVTNPLAPDLTGLATDGVAGAELVQQAAPRARVVKALNTVFAGNQSTAEVDGVQLDGFVAGDDTDAKQTVSDLLARSASVRSTWGRCRSPATWRAWRSSTSRSTPATAGRGAAAGSSSAPCPDQPADRSMTSRRWCRSAPAEPPTRLTQQRSPGMSLSPVRLNHAVLFVTELAPAERFYTEVFGMQVIAREPRANAAFLRLPRSGNHHDLGLFGVASQPKTRGAVGLYHLAWQVDTIDELADARQALLDAGAYTGESSHGATKSLYGADPDGNEFEVMWMLPREEWGAYETRCPHRPARPRRRGRPLVRRAHRRPRHHRSRLLTRTPPHNRANPAVKGTVMTFPVLQDKVAIITGAAMGMGAATAELFAEAGAKVVVADWNEEKGREVAAAIEAAGGSAFFQQVDISDSAQVKAMVDATVERYGRLDVAVNNAAITPDDKPVAELDEDYWDRLMSVDLKGTALSLKWELQQMIRQGGGGSIINISSVSGFRPQPATPAYVAAKHGVNGLTKVAAVENGDHNIRVNAVAPGAIDTPMLRGALAITARRAGPLRRR